MGRVVLGILQRGLSTNENISAEPENGADYRNRTGDLLITSQLLYLLS